MVCSCGNKENQMVGVWKGPVWKVVCKCGKPLGYYRKDIMDEFLAAGGRIISKPNQLKEFLYD